MDRVAFGGGLSAFALVAMAAWTAARLRGNVADYSALSVAVPAVLGLWIILDETL